MSFLEVRDSTQPIDGANHVSELRPESPPVLAVLTAFVGLVFVDAVLHLGGYGYLRRRLVRCVPRRITSADVQKAETRLASAVDQAAMYYPRRAMCLERSAVLTWLLRKHGLPAQFVIGCRHTPFYAHAWVELNGRVLNDKLSVRLKYPEMERV